MAWNPTVSREPVVVPIPSSEGAATITVQPWSTRQRLAYQDQSVSSIQLVSVEGEDGEETQIRRVKTSAVTLTYLAVTITSCTGFGTIDGAPFSFANETHVGRLDPDILDEVFAEATKVQPLPGSTTKAPEDHKAAKAKPLPSVATPETAADFDDTPTAGGESDPSPTLPTPADR